MADAERRTIEELVTRYQFEPSLKDVYVEGAEDKAILEGMLEVHGVSGVSVFEISSVHVPADSGEENSSRTRLVKLARSLLQAFPDGQLCLACVIDTDFDHLTGEGEENTFLLKTDYANMEMYFFAPNVFERLNRSNPRKRRITAHMRERFMVQTLQALFVIRYVNSDPKWHLQELSFDKVLCYKNGRFAFDREEYVRRYLNKNGRAKQVEFAKEVAAVAIPCGLDAHCCMHGHDFLVLLRKMLNYLRGRNVYGNKEVVFSILRVCADYTALAKEPLFATILRRFR